MISKRDEEIFDRRNNGEKVRHIADDYDLSGERVRQIYRKVRKEREFGRNGGMSRKMAKDQNELFMTITANPLGRPQRILSRAFNSLSREWHQRHGWKNGLPTVDFLLSLSNDEIWALNSSGKLTVSYLIDLKCHLIENKEEAVANEI